MNNQNQTVPFKKTTFGKILLVFLLIVVCASLFYAPNPPHSGFDAFFVKWRHVIELIAVLTAAFIIYLQPGLMKFQKWN